jgi:2,3-bisphosphoglycerate-independent phosphoglycerate mutase
MKNNAKILLLILDGFGIAEPSDGNAVSLAKTPTFDFLVRNYPATTLLASGPAVGMPFGENGNSEVGHFAIGTGRAYPQSITQITQAIEDGSFFENPVLLQVAEHTNKNNSSLHIVGLISPGGLHAYDEHAIALLEFAQQQKIKKVFVHMITDGEDTHTPASETYQKIYAATKKYGCGEVATIIGRFFAMDRTGHWERTKATWEALVLGKGELSDSPEKAFSKYQREKITDNLIPPTVIKESQKDGHIKDNDAIIFINYRPERMIQLAQSFINKDFNEFARPNAPKNLFIATITKYLEEQSAPYIFTREPIKNSLAEILDQNKIAQLHVAETEKAAHVKTFFNAMRPKPFLLESDVIIPSPPTKEEYADIPQMAAEKITAEIVKEVSEKKFEFIVANFANTDMVSHTGNLKSSIEAVEFIDQCIKKIYESALENNFTIIITADHGNAEELLNPDRSPNTEHSTNPVPLILINKKYQKAASYKKLSDLAFINPLGGLFDVAPTILEILDIPKPKEMSGESLVSALI